MVSPKQMNMTRKNSVGAERLRMIDFKMSYQSGQRKRSPMPLIASLAQSVSAARRLPELSGAAQDRTASALALALTNSCAQSYQISVGN